MEHEFWHQRWETNAVPFHEGRVNAALERQFKQLALAQGTTIFVPLCGKAVDMRWLRDRGHPVLGVELSRIAVRDFFNENGMTYDEEETGAFVRFSGDGVTLLCGDFFELTPDHLAEVGAVYDRASLVALPADMRGRYAAHLLSVVPRAAPMLTITFEYRQHEMNGPPFSVSESEVRERFGGERHIDLLESCEVIDQAPGLRQRGLSGLREHAFLVASR